MKHLAEWVPNTVNVKKKKTGSVQSIQIDPSITVYSEPGHS